MVLPLPGTAGCVIGAGWPLWLGIGLSALGATAVFTLAVLAYRRRRTTPYLLVALAIGALALRPLVGVGTVLGAVPMDVHHTVEHFLDVLIIGLLIGALLSLRSLESPSESADGDTGVSQGSIR